MPDSLSASAAHAEHSGSYAQSAKPQVPLSACELHHEPTRGYTTSRGAGEMPEGIETKRVRAEGYAGDGSAGRRAPSGCRGVAAPRVSARVPLTYCASAATQAQSLAPTGWRGASRNAIWKGEVVWLTDSLRRKLTWARRIIVDLRKKRATMYIPLATQRLFCLT
jgi:hypothetical protein